MLERSTHYLQDQGRQPGCSSTSARSRWGASSCRAADRVRPDTMMASRLARSSRQGFARRLLRVRTPEQNEDAQMIPTVSFRRPAPPATRATRGLPAGRQRAVSSRRGRDIPRYKPSGWGWTRLVMADWHYGVRGRGMVSTRLHVHLRNPRVRSIQQDRPARSQDVTNLAGWRSTRRSAWRGLNVWRCRVPGGGGGVARLVRPRVHGEPDQDDLDAAFC